MKHFSKLCVYGRPLSATNCTYQIPMERPLIVHLTNDFSKMNQFLLLVEILFHQQKIKIRDTNRKWFLDILSILFRSQFQFTIKLLDKLEILLLAAIKHCQVQWNHDFLIKIMLLAYSPKTFSHLQTIAIFLHLMWFWLFIIQQKKISFSFNLYISNKNS